MRAPFYQPTTGSPCQPTILDQLLPFLVAVDADGRIRSASERTVRLIGFEAHELVGTPLLRFVHREDRSRVSNGLDDARAGSADDQLSARLCNALGVAITMELRCLAADDGVVWIAGVDVTRFVEAQADLKHLAMHDPLTGLPNRALLLDRIAQQIGAARRGAAKFGVLMIDLDGFKKVNDSLGHLAGDELLRQVAERLQSCVREADTVSRIGGDEFVVLLAGSKPPPDAAAVCRRILASFARPFALGEHQVYVTGSVGTATFPDHADAANGLLACADVAMYRAKELGKDRFACFDSTMIGADPGRDVTLETALFNAVRNGEFLLHYQPILNVHGELLGCETLMRWRRADGRMVPPGEFIALAERNGLIMVLGEYALKAACMQLRRFDDAGLPSMYASVNVSPRQLRHPQFARKLEQIVQLTQVCPERLVLEITESMLMREPELVQEQLERLRAIGCRISLDDFGTGYSCLAYLQRFPISVVKVDRTFIAGLPADKAAGAIVGAISGLARALGMSCVAEGVETREQVDALASLGIGQFQGYVFSKPLGPDAFIARFGRKPDTGRTQGD